MDKIITMLQSTDIEMNVLGLRALTSLGDFELCQKLIRDIQKPRVLRRPAIFYSDLAIIAIFDNHYGICANTKQHYKQCFPDLIHYE